MQRRCPGYLTYLRRSCSAARSSFAAWSPSMRRFTCHRAARMSASTKTASATWRPLALGRESPSPGHEVMPVHAIAAVVGKGQKCASGQISFSPEVRQK